MAKRTVPPTVSVSDPALVHLSGEEWDNECIEDVISRFSKWTSTRLKDIHKPENVALMLRLVRDFIEYLRLMVRLDRKRLVEFYDVDHHRDFRDGKAYDDFIVQTEEIRTRISQSLEAHGLDSTGFENRFSVIEWDTLFGGEMTKEQHENLRRIIMKAGSELSRLEKRLVVQTETQGGEEPNPVVEAQGDRKPKGQQHPGPVHGGRGNVINDVQKPEKKRIEKLQHDKIHLRIKIGGKWKDLTDRENEIFTVLFEAKGEWVQGPNLAKGRPDKTIKKMSKQVRNLIESGRYGYRISSLLPE